MKRPRFLEYYRQFEELSFEESSRRLRERRAAERSKELELAPQVDLSSPEWFETPDPEIINAATFALRRALNRYPDAGSGAARAAVATHHDVEVDQVALGHGAGQLLQAALRRLAAGGGAVLPWPSWSLLPALTARAGARPVPVRLGPGDAVDLDAVAAAVDADTRAVVLCSPNDPTGSIIAPGDLREFADALPDHVTLLLDEALVDIAGEEHSAAGLVGELPNLLVLRSFSKGWALAGLRAGYALGPPEATEVLGELEPGLGVAAPAQAAIVTALEPGGKGQRGMERRRRRAGAERDRLAQLLFDSPFSFTPSHTHTVWLAGDGFGGRDIAAGLARQRIAVASGLAWGDERRVRITLRDRATTERLASALRALSG